MLLCKCYVLFKCVGCWQHSLGVAFLVPGCLGSIALKQQHWILRLLYCTPLCGAWSALGCSACSLQLHCMPATPPVGCCVPVAKKAHTQLQPVSLGGHWAPWLTLPVNATLSLPDRQCSMVQHPDSLVVQQPWIHTYNILVASSRPTECSVCGAVAVVCLKLSLLRRGHMSVGLVVTGARELSLVYPCTCACSLPQLPTRMLLMVANHFTGLLIFFLFVADWLKRCSY